MKCKNIILKLFILVCFIIFLISIYILIKDVIAYKENKDTTEQLIQEVIETDSTSKESHINWQQLNITNPDIIGWIEIENTNINYPILNNLYYLKHNYNKQYSSSGSIFTTDTNPFINNETIIYRA